MNINEIFYSLQGEGSRTGAPTIFIRTAGCNLRCSYCDTQYAYEQGTTFTCEKILETVERYPCKTVCITGGEPLLQHNLDSLLKKLFQDNYSVSVETNGSVSIKNLARFADLSIALDIKLPSSGMHEKMHLKNIDFLRSQDQLKCVITDINDYDCAKNLIETHHVCCDIFFQPVWGTSMQSLAAWILRDGLPVRLGMQLHKIIWGDKPGV